MVVVVTAEVCVVMEEDALYGFGLQRTAVYCVSKRPDRTWWTGLCAVGVGARKTETQANLKVNSPADMKTRTQAIHVETLSRILARAALYEGTAQR